MLSFFCIMIPITWGPNSINVQWLHDCPCSFKGSRNFNINVLFQSYSQSLYYSICGMERILGFWFHAGRSCSVCFSLTFFESMGRQQISGVSLERTRLDANYTCLALLFLYRIKTFSLQIPYYMCMSPSPLSHWEVSFRL